MKKNLSIFSFFGVILCALLGTTACQSNKKNALDPFNNGNSDRNLIVVISDLHLGADIKYTETKDNLEPLQKFLEQIRLSKNVQELVIAGDLLDEWFVPANVNTYNGKDQADFVERVASTNKLVFDAFNQIIKEGKITVTYVPGNHDLTITRENVDRILPGIIQVRDSATLGLGTYSPKSCPQIAIEHGHRYNVFCAPDPVSNQNVAPGTILPPGYFFTRIAALHVVQNCHDKSNNVIRPITLPASASESQKLLYKYWGNWVWTMNYLPIENTLDTPIIITNINGFTQTYAVNDLLPSQSGKDSIIRVNLFDKIQDTWAQRCSLNHVQVPIDAGYAFDNAATDIGTDSMAVTQYFMNKNSDKRIVVFGHTHVAKLLTYQNYNDQKSIYVNSGTWIDAKPEVTTMNFVVITPQNTNAQSATKVTLYNFRNKKVTQMASDSIQL